MSDTDAPDVQPPRRSPDDADEPVRLQASRTVLGALLAILTVAVLLALWSLLFGGDDGETAAPTTSASTVATGEIPTSFVVPTTAPTVTPPPQVTAEPTEPTVVPTPLPAGFEACGGERSPLPSATYIVDTVSTPLNQRAEPSVNGTLLGAFDPGLTGLTFNGECVVNLADGYVWWQIFNGSQDVWIASDFVSPN